MMLDIVKNDFNVVKYNNELLSVEEDDVDIYDATLTLLAEQFDYMEILEDE